MRLVVSVLALLLTACDESRYPIGPTGGGLGAGAPIDPSATFTRVQSEIFTPSCSSVVCHSLIAQASQLVLTAGQSYAAIVNVRSVENPALFLIAPNDPASSYLYRKITGAGITGDRMPLELPPLAEIQIALVRDWIRRGAPND